MTYNPGTPQQFDIPAESQNDFVTNFSLINQFFGVDHIPFGNTVTNATNANPCICTSPNHGLTTGNTVNISHFATQDVPLQLWDINGGPYTATVIDVNTFSINADASADGLYLANSGAFQSPNLPYGMHTRTFLPNPVFQAPNTVLPSPYSAYYSKVVQDVTQLFYQNSSGAAFEKQMTNLPVVQTSNENGVGIVTPWGVIINFGIIDFKGYVTGPLPAPYDFPIPFTSALWSITGTIGIKQGKSQNYAIFADLSTFTPYFLDIPLFEIGNIMGFYMAIGV